MPSANPPGELKYRAVEEKMRELVARLPRGARLPSERELADELGINFLTVRRGVMQLVKDGLVWRKVGSGTYVGSRSDAVRLLPPEDRPASGRLGMVIAQEADAYAHRLMRTIARQAAQKNIEIISVWSENFADDARRQIQALERQGCTAVLIPWFPSVQASNVVALSRNSALPVAHPQVFVGYDPTNSAHRRTRKVVESLCTYLHDHTGDRLAYLGPNDPENGALQLRIGAFSMACAERNLAPLLGLVTATADSLNQLAGRWKEHAGRLAVLAYDDGHASRFLTGMHRLGLSAPADFRIIGFNNTEVCRMTDPPLSTVAQDFDHVALQLLSNAQNLSRGLPARYEEMKDNLLVVRSSCGGRAFLEQNPQIRFPGLTWTVEERAPVAG